MSVAKDWMEKELDQLVVIDPENLREDTDSTFSFYYIDIGAVSKGKITLPSHKITFRESPSRARKVVHRGDVLMSTVRPNLRAFAYFDHTDDDCTASTGFAVLRARVDSDSQFILYAILSDSVTAQIEAHIVGSNYPAINSSTVSKLRVLSPPFPEQTKIAEILSTVDRAIEQTEAIIAKQQRIKTGLMQDLLTRGIDEHGNIRSEETHEFKDSLLKGIRMPTSWMDSEFRKVTSVNQGLQIPIEKRFKEEGPNRYKYITVQYLNNPDKYLEYIEKPPSQLVCNEDDILFTRTGNTGQIITGVEGVYHNNFFKIAYDKTKVYGDYLVRFLNWQPIQELIKERAGTTTIPDLNHGDFYSLPLFLPQLDEQKLISEILRIQNVDFSTGTRKLAKLRSLKTALMQDLLTGKKRVTALLNDTEEITS